jgi:hypothetical protein
MRKSEPFWQYAFKLLPTKCVKFDNKKLQLAGPIGVIAAVACAECGAHALAYWPSSSLLWFVDLEVFRPLQYSFGAANERLAFGDLAQTLFVVTPLLALICVGLITGRRLPLALASNVSLLYSAVFLYGSYLANSPAADTGIAVLLVPSFFLAVSILLAAFLSSAISHLGYWREIFFKEYIADEAPFQAQFAPYRHGRLGRTDENQLRLRTGENANF